MEARRDGSSLVFCLLFLSFFSTDLWIVVVAAVQVVPIVPGVPVGGTLKAIVSSSHGFVAGGGSTPGQSGGLLTEAQSYFVGRICCWNVESSLCFAGPLWCGWMCLCMHSVSCGKSGSV